MMDFNEPIPSRQSHVSDTSSRGGGSPPRRSTNPRRAARDSEQALPCSSPSERDPETLHEFRYGPQPTVPCHARSEGEPLAIIGIGCRFPGQVESWRDYWKLLVDGRDAITETPAERWSLNKFFSPSGVLPGKTQSKWGGFVEAIDQFDPGLFGISPREAANMDPQQRMLLEVAYRALEDGGQPLASLAGQPVSVFVGISSFDYAVASLSNRDRGVINAYSNTGGSSSIAANRISYCFDLRGPSVAVDTACSSSLVALHMGCESVWRGEANMALVGGVNALLLPDFNVAFSQLGVLSPDGRCKTFDERANGYVRSEGAGMVLLKPLSQAVRQGDPIYAMIRATALNQDGRTPGMTVPSGEAQQALIRQACKRAHVQPHDLQYVEAHGTGTPTGDPIEATAIGSLVGRGRLPGDYCRVGSVKTNIGHLEAGAGMASLIKVALALHHRQIPAHLHYQQTHPEIDLEHLGLRVPRRLEAWQTPADRPRLAGINGFGYGGANAHAILEEAPEACRRRVASMASDHREGSSNGHEAPPSSEGCFAIPIVMPLSARTLPALREFAQQLLVWLEAEGAKYHPAEIASYLAHRRSHHELRFAACAGSREALYAELRRLAQAGPEDEGTGSRSTSDAPGLAFVCSGQGPQWWGMGRGLLECSPVFRQAIEACDAEFARWSEWSLIDQLQRCEGDSRMQETAIAQPSLFALQIALAAVWKSWGVQPTAVVGHSVGEIAAAYLSGALNFQDACAVAYHRGRTMDLASSKGAMLAAGLSREQALEWIAGQESQLSLAAVNGPCSVTFSGATDCIERLAQQLEAVGVFCRRLVVEYAFHSPQMDPVHDELLRSLQSIRPRDAHTPLISTVTGKRLNGQEVDANYWWQNVRQPVQFVDAMGQLAESGYRHVIELGPHPVLAYAINECFQHAGRHITSFASLRRDHHDLQRMTQSLGELYTSGCDIDWSGFYRYPSRHLPLPVYPFQRQRCWAESLESRHSRQTPPEHPLLGEPQLAPEPGWQQRIDLRLQQDLGDHRVRGAAVFPAAAIIETGLAAARSWRRRRQTADSADTHPASVLRLQRVELLAPLGLSQDTAHWLETRLQESTQQLTLAQREIEQDAWSELARLRIATVPHAAPGLADGWQGFQAEIQQRCQESFDAERLYAYCQQSGLEYGPAFRRVLSGIRCDGEAWLSVDATNTTLDVQAPDAYCIPPGVLDSCFHGMIAADPNFDQIVDGLYLPATIEDVCFWGRLTERIFAHVRLRSKTSRAMICDLDIYNSDGQCCCALRGFESRRVNGGPTLETTEDLIYGYRWKRQPLTSNDHEPFGDEPPRATGPEDSSDCGEWLVFADRRGVSQAVIDQLRGGGRSILEVRSTTVFDDPSSSSVVAEQLLGDEVTHRVVRLAPDDREGFRGLLERFSAAQAKSLAGIVYLWGIDAPSSEALTADTLRESCQITTLAPLYLVQAWDELDAGNRPRLSIVTSGAQSQDDAPESTLFSQGPLIGLGRVIISECAKFRTRLIDLPAMPEPHDISALNAEIASTDDEDEIMIRCGERYVHRFEPLKGSPLAEHVASQHACHLQLGKTASLQELHYATRAQRPLQPHQIEIRVMAAGLNFSDVMKSLGLYPGLPNLPVELGAECSGVVTRVGEAVDWQIGDEVLAVAPGAFGSHVVVDAQLAARKPDNLSHQEAAALPIAFLTAEYAMHQCARLKSGDSILIHSASGGVGLAAMQLAAADGLRVYATAGTETKREYVRDLGAIEVMDSRSLEFVDQILDSTTGHSGETEHRDEPGVDAILNSLPGEAIRGGLSILKTGGRFLELGKRDIYNDAALGLYPMRNNLALFAIDLDQLFKRQPRRMGDMFRRLVERFERGELRPLPTTVFGADETRTAFRFMQQGKHVGKIVIDYSESPSEIFPDELPPVQLRADASYWIAGGLGGFGLEVAKWMVQRGARHLVLSGRRRSIPTATEEKLAELKADGAEVTILPVDITQTQQVERALETIDASLPPLRGVVHAAMVLEDRLLTDLDRQTLERVLMPKVVGGWNLHQATRDRELDHFVLFSSLSSVFGHAGQANYSAANALLDSLAYHRRAAGLPATVINWGYLGEVGYLAEREALGERLERQGVLSFNVRQALDCLEFAVQTQAVQFSVLRIDWSVWRGLSATDQVSPRFAHLLRQSPDVSAMDATDSRDPATLRLLSAQQRQSAVLGMLCHKTSVLLGIARSEIPTERALLEMGLDSLMAVELRNWLESQLQISVPIAALMRGNSLEQLSREISHWLSDTTPPVASPRASTDDEPPESVGAATVESDFVRDDTSADSDVRSVSISANYCRETTNDIAAGLLGSGSNSELPEPSSSNAHDPIPTSPNPQRESQRAEALLERLPEMDEGEVNRLLGQILGSRK